MDQTDLSQLDDYQWEVPASFRDGMRVPVRIFANEALLGRVLESRALKQAIEVAMLPGLVGHLVVMPDVHAGQGAPFGVVAAVKYPVGVIAPGAIGHDVGSGVRLLGSSLDREALDNEALDDLADALEAHVPSGAEAEGTLNVGKAEIDHIAKSGAQWALRQDMAEQDDLVRAEEGGRLNEADPGKVSDEARALGAKQLGTLGTGEHFIEVGVVDEVFHPPAAETMGTPEGTLVVQIHCGSRGYGRQICTDYIERFQEEAPNHGVEPPSPELACVPLESKGASDYMGAMRAAANYAYANRQVLAHRVREAFGEVLEDEDETAAANVSDAANGEEDAGEEETDNGEDDGDDDEMSLPTDALHTVYDVAHNLGQLEMHQVGRKHLRCYVHRKGAARAFGPGTPGISLPYRALGQPVLVPGAVGEASWILLGTSQNMRKSFGSACHGSARNMSRHDEGHAADDHAASTRLEGLRVRAGGDFTPAAEAQPAGEGGTATLPETSEQQSVDAVVDTVAGARIARKVARVKPLIVVRA
jgi:tRNA-splicing ligase RtcB